MAEHSINLLEMGKRIKDLRQSGMLISGDREPMFSSKQIVSFIEKQFFL